MGGGAGREARGRNRREIPRRCVVAAERNDFARSEVVTFLPGDWIGHDRASGMRGDHSTRREIPRLAEQLATLAGSRKRSLRNDTRFILG